MRRQESGGYDCPYGGWPERKDLFGLSEPNVCTREDGQNAAHPVFFGLAGSRRGGDGGKSRERTGCHPERCGEMHERVLAAYPLG